MRPQRRRPRVVALEHVRRRAAASDRSRGCGWRGAGRGAPRRASMPRWCSWTCACVQASVDGALEGRRVAVLVGQRRAPRRATAATSVEKTTRAVAPGASRTRRRRLKIGSSTVPAVFESGRPSITDIGVRMPRPRPRKRARSVSYCAPPPVSPSTTTTCAAQTGGSLGRARPARREQRADVGHELGLRRTGWRRPDARRRRPAARARSRRRRSARSRAARVPEVRERDAAHLGVVLGRDHDLERRS